MTIEIIISIIGLLLTIVLSVWGIIQWAIKQHNELRRDMTQQLRLLQSDLDDHKEKSRNHDDDNMEKLREEIRRKADQSEFDKTMNRILNIIDGFRSDILKIYSEIKK